MDLLNAVALSTLPGIARGRAAGVFKELREQAPGGSSPGGPRVAGVALEEVIACCTPAADVDDVAAAARSDAATLLARAPAAGIVPVPWDDERYPPLLRAIVDPPPVLWVRGQMSAIAVPAVAIVGSRAATPYALEVASRLAGELAERGLLVVSGLARGADGAAHRGCLRAGGATVAVLGCGPDVIYPAEHRALSVSICEAGALVSELGPGAPPLQEHFPQRNRLISGISLAVVVIEASDRSGSLITARFALEQGRDVMAVPGSVLGGRNRGSHALLKDGAKVVETADDILEELGWPALRGVQGPAPGAVEGLEEGPLAHAGAFGRAEISANPLKTDALLARLTPGNAYDLDEMSATLGLAGWKLLPRLTEWEMRGQVVKVAGGRYVLAGRN
jgi:DNA processing protein